jgi:hypothetical protein
MKFFALSKGICAIMGHNSFKTICAEQGRHGYGCINVIICNEKAFNRPMPKSSFGSIRLCFQAADDDENGDFVITLMDQGNGKVWWGSAFAASRLLFAAPKNCRLTKVVSGTTFPRRR